MRAIIKGENAAPAVLLLIIIIVMYSAMTGSKMTSQKGGVEYLQTVALYQHLGYSPVL
jgi:hypothetical protein